MYLSKILFLRLYYEFDSLSAEFIFCTFVSLSIIEREETKFKVSLKKPIGDGNSKNARFSKISFIRNL